MPKNTEDKSNYFSNWFINHLSVVNIILSLLAIIISVFPINDIFVAFNKTIDDSKIKIISLLVIIVTDFFVMNIGYLERIVKSTARFDMIAEHISKTAYSFEPCDYIKISHQAQNSIFFSGIGMSHFNYGLAHSLAKVDPRVEINCVVSDSNSSNFKMLPNINLDIQNRTFFNGLRAIFDNNINSIRNIRNINVEFINIFFLFHILP